MRRARVTRHLAAPPFAFLVPLCGVASLYVSRSEDSDGAVGGGSTANDDRNHENQSVDVTLDPAVTTSLETMRLVHIDMPVPLPANLELSPQALEQLMRESVVLELSRQGYIGSGRGATLLGITRSAFLNRLALRGISWFDATMDLAIDAQYARSTRRSYDRSANTVEAWCLQVAEASESYRQRLRCYQLGGHCTCALARSTQPSYGYSS